MKSQSIDKSVNKKHTVRDRYMKQPVGDGHEKKTVRDRYATALPVLVPASPEQIKQGDYDGLANFDLQKPYTLKVKIFGPEYITGTELSVTVRQSMGKKWDLFIASNQLRDAHEQGGDYEIGLAYRKLVTAMLPEQQIDKPAMVEDRAVFWTDPKWTKSNAPVNLPPAITQEMTLARLVLWWNKSRERFFPAIFCDDYGTAMFVRGALRDVRACPGCDRAFIPARADQEYHDVGCRERHRQRRFQQLHGKKKAH
jgi:hypothetical protein